jgi:hypothetical protein
MAVLQRYYKDCVNFQLKVMRTARRVGLVVGACYEKKRTEITCGFFQKRIIYLHCEGAFAAKKFLAEKR